MPLDVTGGEWSSPPGWAGQSAAAMGSKLGRTRGEQTRHREHFWDLNPSHKYQSFSLFRYTIILYYNIYKKYHVPIYAMYKIDSAMTIF